VSDELYENYARILESDFKLANDRVSDELYENKVISIIERLYFEGSREEYSYYLIIYDIVDDKRRRKISKILEGYGVRVQYSAFEMWLQKRKYNELVSKLERYTTKEDNMRIYPLNKELIKREENEVRKKIQCDVVIV